MNEALRKAADLIEANGWWQAKSDSDEVNGARYCALTAISAASKGMPSKDVREKLKKYLSIDNITAWNDTPGRTKDEVIAALRAAAELP